MVMRTRFIVLALVVAAAVALSATVATSNAPAAAARRHLRHRLGCSRQPGLYCGGLTPAEGHDFAYEAIAV
jgi:hypothetical protein